MSRTLGRSLAGRARHRRCGGLRLSRPLSSCVLHYSKSKSFVVVKITIRLCKLCSNGIRTTCSRQTGWSSKKEPDRVFLSKHDRTDRPRRERRQRFILPDISRVFSSVFTDLIRPQRSGKLSQALPPTPTSPPPPPRLLHSSPQIFFFFSPSSQQDLFPLCFPHFRRILFDFEVVFRVQRRGGQRERSRPTAATRACELCPTRRAGAGEVSCAEAEEGPRRIWEARPRVFTAPPARPPAGRWTAGTSTSTSSRRRRRRAWDPRRRLAPEAAS